MQALGWSTLDGQHDTVIYSDFDGRCSESWVGMKYVINGACLLKTDSVEAEETWTGSLSQTSDMQWMKKILKCMSTEVFLNGADMVVERSDLVGVI